MSNNLYALIGAIASLGWIKKKTGSWSLRWGREAAGILFICPEDGTVLLGHRSEHVYEPHTVGIFGGKLDYDDTSPKQAAIRETIEETGSIPTGSFVGEFVYLEEDPPFKYTTYLYAISLEEKLKWEITLNWENDNAVWYPIDSVINDNLNIPIHFGVKDLMAKNELEIKRIMKPHRATKVS
jgi:8-oxo-dGTP pyrophosphatase MutT (NUDIX family)